MSLGQVTAPNHSDQNRNYYSIGSNDIIAKRSSTSVATHPSKTFRDFVAFYFGKRSIMLYNIITGYSEIEKVSQDEIIYLVCNISDIHNLGYDYFFTDGHALMAPLTKFYTNLRDLARLDTVAINARDFSASAELEYPDLKRRKQAEFHILDAVNFQHISQIVVSTKSRQVEIQQMLKDYNYNISAKIDKTFYFK